MIDRLHAASKQAVADRLELSWDEVHGIMDRAVRRGLGREATPMPRIGVDEKAFRKGHRYVTIVTDLDRGCVLHVAADRKQDSLEDFWNSLTPEQLGSIEAVAMDMWEPFVQSVRAYVPDADEKIVFDKFHVAKHLGEAVDQVRRAENKELRAEGDQRLKGTRYKWLRNADNHTREQWLEFRELRNSNLRTARAWSLKEQAMALWDYVYEGPARKHFDWWYSWAIRSRLKPMMAKARMIKSHLENILTYLRHQVTNAVSESLNSKIQWVKYTSRGFRNFDNFVTSIYFHCGGLDLMPGSTPQPSAT